MQADRGRLGARALSAVLVLGILWLFAGVMAYLASKQSWPLWLPILPFYCAAYLVSLWVIALWSSFARSEVSKSVRRLLIVLPPVGVLTWAARTLCSTEAGGWRVPRWWPR